MNTLLLLGSRNATGRTARATEAMRIGIEKHGGTTETVFLPTVTLERCRQCNDDGWGMCRAQGQCVISDHFDSLVRKIMGADRVVFATPVYFSDLSESLRAFTDRLRRTSWHEQGKKKIEGKIAVGLCVAGGGGGGSPACCVSLEKVLTTCGFKVVDMIPARRQNLDEKLPALQRAGEWLMTNDFKN